MDMISLSMGFFPERTFRRVNCFLEEARITFYKIGKEIFTKGCESPNSFAPFRFNVNCRSRTRRRDIIVQERSPGILDLKGKMFSK